MRRTNIVEQIRDTLHRDFPTADVILFGSEARGDARPDSDIDLLVLLDKEHVTNADKDMVYVPLYNIELATFVPINAQIYSKAYWEKRPMDYFKYNIQNEGIKL